MSNIELLSVNELTSTLILDRFGCGKDSIDYYAFDNIDEFILVTALCHAGDMDWLMQKYIAIKDDMTEHLTDILEWFAIAYYVRNTNNTMIPIDLWNKIIDITSQRPTRFTEITDPIDAYIDKYIKV